ncbi:hemolysin family protein [Thalassoglobus sp.]|uniref:hemolysin family protein n=1 Tax=Thalassoglobus sp. TaxID=2795869 RepID=UPI003AA7B46E
MVNPILIVSCFLLSIFFSVVSESLRNFLRSRLAFVCRLQKNDERFGIILRDDEVAVQVAETLRFVTLCIALLLGSIERYHGVEVITNSMIWSDVALVSFGIWICLWVLPWTISRVVAEHLLFHTWPVIAVVIRLSNPLLAVSQRVDTFVHRMAGRQDPTPENIETLTEEIQSVVDEGEREGILESRAGKMIHRVMELRQEDVRAVMTPRTDIISIQAEASLGEARVQLLEAGHSRIPVVEGSADNIIGILYARDLLEHIGNGNDAASLKEIVRGAFYVPETNSIDTLLNRMKQERLHLAIVLDEYGGVTGLVTLEDILEEIVGEIADEFDEHEDDRIEWLDPHTLLIDARMHIDEMNDMFDLELPEDRDFDTLGGLVFSELERVPKSGERFDWNGIQFTVLEATERKIIRIQLYSPVAWPTVEEVPLQADSQNAGDQAPFRLIREEPSAEERAS